MKETQVKNIMVPISEYATVYEDMTLYEAILVLEKSKRNFDKSKDGHKAILVKSREDNSVTGKIGQLDVIRALEPKYELLVDENSLSKVGLSKFGLSPQFMKSMLEHYKLWDESLATICRQTGEKKVSQLMYTPTQGEYINADANLSEAVHQLVLGHHHGLIVTESDGDIVGVLRLSDVFVKICEIMKEEHQP